MPRRALSLPTSHRSLSPINLFCAYIPGRDKGSYYHEFFLRGKIFLAKRIQRFRINGEGIRRPNSAESEPTFYDFPFLPEIERAPTRIARAPIPVGSSAFGGVLQGPPSLVLTASASMERRQLIAQLAMGRPMPVLGYQEALPRRVYVSPPPPTLAVGGTFAPRGRPVTPMELLSMPPRPERSPLLQALLRLPFPQQQPIPQRQASIDVPPVMHSSFDPRPGST